MIQRINRKFAKKEGELCRQQRKTKGRIRFDIGDFYIFDPANGGITTRFVDVEKTARKLRVLADWEYLLRESNAATSRESD